MLSHPDISDNYDATERTMALTNAYQMLSSELAVPTPLPRVDDADQHLASPKQTDPLEIRLLDDLTLLVAAPPKETLMLLIDMAHELGEISYLDPTAGLLEIVIEFLVEPTSSVLLSMQARPSGVTEVLCSVEPLSGGISPPADAVARLLLRTLTHSDQI